MSAKFSAKPRHGPRACSARRLRLQVARPASSPSTNLAELCHHWSERSTGMARSWSRGGRCRLAPSMPSRARRVGFVELIVMDDLGDVWPLGAAPPKGREVPHRWPPSSRRSPRFSVLQRMTEKELVAILANVKKCVEHAPARGLRSRTPVFRNNRVEWRCSRARTCLDTLVAHLRCRKRAARCAFSP